MRLALRFDSLTTPQLRTVLAAFAMAKHAHPDDVGGISQTSETPLGVIVGCDGAEFFNATTPPLSGRAITVFMERAAEIGGSQWTYWAPVFGSVTD